MKTVLQELIELRNKSFDAMKFINFFDENKNELLEKEKQQIIDAYSAGEIRPYNGIKYYDSTFGDSNEAGI